MNRRLFLKVISCIAAVACVLVTTGVLSAQSRGVNGLERALEAQEKHTAKMMEKAGVVGTAVGLDDDSNPVVLVLLENGNVPGIPAQLDGVKVKKMVTGKIYALKPPSDKPGKPPKDPVEPIDPTGRFERPVPIGVSTGHPDITAGTIGCRVTGGGNIYALSNNHVYADENLAEVGDAVIQPGDFDSGVSPADDIGTLAAYVPIVFSTSASNTVDAAIALTTVDLVGNATPADGYGVPQTTTANAAIGMTVLKYGRTTGQTKGRISAINATVNVGYTTGTARFVEQIIVGTAGFSAGGDSGSLIVVSDKRGKNEGVDHLKPVGLLFAGNDLVTIANPIDLVLEKFRVGIDGK